MEQTSNSQTIIAPEVEIIGTIKTSGSIEMNGKLEGDLHCDGDAKIGKTAQIKGNIHANAIAIGGTINGNMIARDRIQMLATARVMGDIKSKRLSVEDGVTFIGRSEVNPSGQPVSGAAPTAKPDDSDKNNQAIRK